MSMSYIHETVIRDIVDVAKGLKNEDEIKRITNFNNRASFKSINTRSEALTIVFPTIASRNCSYESAAKANKALERKNVSLLTMLFAAVQITDAEDAFDYIKKFHTNLDMKSFGVDDFLHAMDSYVESHIIKNELNEVEIMEAYEAIKEDMKAMNVYSEASLSDFKVVTYDGYNKTIENTNPVNEAIDWKNPAPFWQPPQTMGWDGYGNYVPMIDPNSSAYKTSKDLYDRGIKVAQMADNRSKADSDDAYRQQQAEYQKQRDLTNDKRKDREYKQRELTDAENIRLQSQKNNIELTKLQMSVNQNRLLDQDVKKSNELQPTLMMVNFIAKGDTDSAYPIYSHFVVGVKCKLYAVDGQDILNRFKIKNNDKNLLLNLVKVGTREISFFKDFLFAVDNAKLDAISQSRRGSSNKIWKVLERRALKSKVRRSLNMINDATAITSIVVTADEVEFFKKTEYIDLENPKVIRRIMDAYNLLNFVIMDDSLEVAKFITDSGDDVYELVTYDNLERENKDNTKKILNLMNKMR